MFSLRICDRFWLRASWFGVFLMLFGLAVQFGVLVQQSEPKVRLNHRHLRVGDSLDSTVYPRMKYNDTHLTVGTEELYRFIVDANQK